MQDVIKFMKSCDIDMEGAWLKHIVQFTSSKNLCISELKKHLTSAYESDGCQVLLIEGGIVE